MRPPVVNNIKNDTSNNAKIINLVTDKIIFNGDVDDDDVAFANGILSIFIYYPIIINI
jgi:flagellar basal body P-ring protein FlgI